MLHNPFYIGLIRLKRTGEYFPGIHEPLITKSQFDRVQAIFDGKTFDRPQQHKPIFSRLIKCKNCSYSLIGEKQRGHFYYRCHTKTCPSTCIREEHVEDAVLRMLTLLEFTEDEMSYISLQVEKMKEHWTTEEKTQIEAVTLKLHKLHERLMRLTDIYLEHQIEFEIFSEKKRAILMEQKKLEETLEILRDKERSLPDRLKEFIEQAKSSTICYKRGFRDEKRGLLKIITSNIFASGKEIDFAMKNPFAIIYNRSQLSNSAPSCGRPRTLDKLVEAILHFLKNDSKDG